MTVLNRAALFKAPAVASTPPDVGMFMSNSNTLLLDKGTHDWDTLVSRYSLDTTLDNFMIKGLGKNKTIISAPDGITITGKYPDLSGFQLVGPGTFASQADSVGIGLNILNSRDMILHQVKVYGYETQVRIAVEDDPTGLLFNYTWFASLKNLILTDFAEERLNTTKACRALAIEYDAPKTSDTGGWNRGLNFINNVTVSESYLLSHGAPLTIDGATVSNFNQVYLGGGDDSPCIIRNHASDIVFTGCSSELSGADFKIEDANNTVGGVSGVRFIRFRWQGNNPSFKSGSELHFVDESDVNLNQHADFAKLYLSPDYYN